MSSAIFIGREIEVNRILEEIKKPHNSPDVKKIIGLHGIGGAGKTTLLNKVQEKIKEENLQLAYFRINEDIKFENLPEFVNALAKTFFCCSIPNTNNNFSKVADETTLYLQIAGKIESIFTTEEKAELNKLKEEIVEMAKQKGRRTIKFPSAFGIDLGEFQGREVDGELAARYLKELYDKQEEKIISERYKHPEDQKFFQNPFPRLTETFLSDLESSIYPSYEKIIKEGWFWDDTVNAKRNEENKPLKVLFIFDTYEKISDEISNWLLEYFLPEIDKKREIFDARFIISGREQLRLSDHHRRWDRYGKELDEFDIHRFAKNEVAEYLQKREIPQESLDDAYEQTEGLAYLLDIWADTRGKGEALVYGQAANRIFWWKDPDEKEWIKAAAFLDYYDEDSLSVFLGKENAKNAYEWLKECHEVTRSSSMKDGKFQLHPTVRKVIMKSVEQQSDEKFQDYQQKAEVYKNIMKQFPAVEHRKQLLQLSHFSNFNQLALEDIFHTDSFKLHNFAKEHPEWFAESILTFKMNSDLKELFLKYASWREQEDIKKLQNEIKEKWEQRKKELLGKIENMQNIITSREQEKQTLSVQIKSIEENINETKGIIRQNVQVKDKIEKSIQSKLFNIVSPDKTLPFIVAMAGFVMSIIAIFMQETLQIGFFIIGVILIVSGIAVFLHGKTSYKQNKQQREENTKRDLEELQNRLENERKKVNNYEKERIQLQFEMLKCSDEIDKSQHKMKEYEQVLNEPWI